LLPVVVYILFLCLESAEAANRYLRAHFKQLRWEKELRNRPNVFLAASDLHTSTFCTDRTVLERAYCHGLSKGKEAMGKLVGTSTSL
jgi:hypothetical protein